MEASYMPHCTRVQNVLAGKRTQAQACMRLHTRVRTVMHIHARTRILRSLRPIREEALAQDSFRINGGHLEISYMGNVRGGCGGSTNVDAYELRMVGKN